MSQFALQARADLGPSVSIRESMLRAAAELLAVRTGMESAFDLVHAHATEQTRAAQPYLVAMQSIDLLSQQVAAIERYLANLSAEFGEHEHISTDRAAAGITLAAVAARLTAAPSNDDHDAGECDFF
jgi:hypothetical protein